MNIEIPKKSLWQYLDKSMLDDEGQLTDEQWQEFLNKNNDHFASECSYIGRELFEDFLGELEAKESEGLMKYKYDHIIKLLIQYHKWPQVPLYRGKYVLN